jgi:hypothetical protein
LDDWEHDVCVHLLTLPSDSVFRTNGCADRISTYDPDRRGGGSEPLFIDYIYLIIDNFCRSRFRTSNQLSAKTITLSDLFAETKHENPVDEDEAVASRSSAFKVCFDPVTRITCRELIQRARHFDPLLPAVIDALVVYSSQREAASHLQVTEKVFRFILRDLRMLARGERVPQRKRRNRKPSRLAA